MEIQQVRFAFPRQNPRTKGKLKYLNTERNWEHGFSTCAHSHPESRGDYFL